MTGRAEIMTADIKARQSPRCSLSRFSGKVQPGTRLAKGVRPQFAACPLPLIHRF
jgi:hypothetical protein